MEIIYFFLSGLRLFCFHTEKIKTYAVLELQPDRIMYTNDNHTELLN